MAIVVTCTCGKQFKVKDELAGKRGKCAACGQVLSVPTLAPSLDQEKASPSTQRACPTCQKAVEPAAVICVNCGHDLRTGKQLPQAKSSAPAAPFRPSAKAPASPARIWIALVAGGICLAGVAAAVTLLSRGREPRISATAPKPNPGTQNAPPLAKSLSTIQNIEPQTATPTSNPPTPRSSLIPTQVPLVPGIDEPLSVEGGDIQLQLTTAKRMDTYSANPDQVYRPQSETYIFLVVEAKILSGDLAKVRNMDVSIIDENGREMKPGVITTYDNRKTVVWPITVARSSHSFTLHLPNNHMITLDSLISSVRDQNVKGTPPAVPAPTMPKTAGPLTFQVKSLKPQKSYEYRDYRGNASISAKADDTLLLVNLSIQNGGQAWETFSSSSFRIVDKDGKPVDAPLQGFGNNVIASGEIGIERKSSDGDGNAFLKIKGKLDANEPKNTLVDWELAPGKSYTEIFVFVIPAQTQGPRFEMAKK